MPKYIPIIGMEVHVELKTKSKMFCGCKNEPDTEKPNTNVCEICLAHPGTLPVPNKQALEWIVKIGKALNCEIRDVSKFDRKHYFYPDLPKGYQISQYDEPVCEHGNIELNFPTGKNHREKAEIGITRVHMEEDTAKSSHDKDGTLIDFNRSGVPLVEIVTDPDIKNGIEAKAYCQELQLIFRYLDVSDADMEKGHMRCEANISLQEEDKFEIEDGLVKPLKNYKLNNKVELKNINSFKAIEKAIDFEIKRQTEMLEKNEDWPQQTRGWDENLGESVMQREKETSADYRYFPEPDIPPFHPAKIAGNVNIPELPQARRARFKEEYGFSHDDAYLLTSNKLWSKFTESTMSELIDWLHSLPEVKGDTDEIMEDKKQKIARLAGGWLTSKLMGIMAEKKIDIKNLNLSAENFAELIALIYTERINSTNALKILGEMVESKTDLDPTHIMEEKGYGQISDEGKINEIVAEVIKNYPAQIEEYKRGKEQVLKFLVGMAMKATEGSADPQVVEKMLKEKIK